MDIKKFFFQYVIFAVFVFLAPYALNEIVPQTILSNHFVLLFVFIFSLTLIVYILSYLGIKKGGEISVLGILGGLTIKMVFSLALILVLILKTTENQKVLALNFFYLYFLFTLFEVICLLRNLRDQNKT